jgi:23S rRNA pseudouridine1911/1915/1917 synthase
VSQSFVVSPKETGKTLAAVLKARLGLSWSQARRLVELRRVSLRTKPGVSPEGCGDPVRRVRAGQQIEIRETVQARPKAREKKPLAVVPGEGGSPRARKKNDPLPTLRFADEAIVVVDKPVGVTTHRSGAETDEFGARGKKFLPTTLADRIPALLPDGGPVRAVHRIDRDTSGLVVFARTPDAEADLGKQFRAHTVGRRYLAITRGRPVEGRIESWLVRDRGDGRRGSGPPGEGQRAITHVRVLEDLGQCCLVECRLETGRTHQVRIHLGEAGAPLAGERIYDRPLNGPPAADPSGSPRLALHAAYLGLTHPTTREWVEWESPLPEDLQAVVRRLRAGRARPSEPAAPPPRSPQRRS